MLRALAPLAVLAPLLAACAEAPQAGLLRFVEGAGTVDRSRPNYHDFDRVADGERVEHVYFLRNDGAAPVTILDVVPGCGCTVPALRYRDAEGGVVEGRSIRPGARPDGPLLEVPPGVTAELVLRIDAGRVRPKNTHRLYTTRITTDAEASAFLTAETHILVEDPFQVVPETIDLGRVPLSGGGRASARVSVLSGYDVRPTRTATVTEPFVVGVHEEVERGLRSWEVEVTIEPPVQPGPLAGTVTVETEDASGAPDRPLQIPVAGFGVPDLQTTPARLILVADASATGAAATAELYSLLPGKRLVVHEASVAAEHTDQLEVAFEPVSPDARGRSERWRITLSVGAPLTRDVARGSVLVRLEGDEDATAEIPYVVHRR